MDTSFTDNSVPKAPEAVGHHSTGERFFPSGAIAFFIALVVLCLIIWFGIYFLMIERV